MRTRRSWRNQDRLWKALAGAPVIVPPDRKSTMSQEEYSRKTREIEAEEAAAKIAAKERRKK